MTASREEANIRAALSFVRSVEAMDGSQLDAHFAPDVEQQEMPNLFKPAGTIRDLAALKADIGKSRGIIEDQRYDIGQTLASGDAVVLEMTWHGRVVTDDLPSLRRGQELRARCVAVFEFRDGKIARLRNYDCFDPLPAA